MKLKLTISILIAVILILILTMVITANQHVRDLNKASSDYNYQQERYLENISKQIENYNELYADYNELNKKYHELKMNLSLEGWQLFTVTGYSADDPEQGTNSIVATTFNLDYVRVQNLPIVASNCIPLYSIIEIKELGGFIVLDTGLGYKTDEGWEDEKWIDILFPTKEQAINFGTQKLFVKVLK